MSFDKGAVGAVEVKKGEDKEIICNCYMFIKTRSEKIDSVRFHLIYANNRKRENVMIISGLSPLDIKREGEYVRVTLKEHDILLTKDNNALSLLESEVMMQFGRYYSHISAAQLLAISTLMYEL